MFHLRRFAHQIAGMQRIVVVAYNGQQLPDGKLRGWLAPLTRVLTGVIRLFPLVPFDAASENQFQHMRASRLRLGTLDWKIAAIAMTKGLTVVTPNRSDFGRVPDLVLEDWSV
jgi:tRNA(fMet)-specific endonuclease VapC